MTTCKDCHFGSIERNGRKWVVWCRATDEIIDYKAAMDCDLGCDLFVQKLDDNETQEH